MEAGRRSSRPSCQDVQNTHLCAWGPLVLYYTSVWCCLAIVRGGGEVAKNKETNLFKDLLAAIFTTDGMLDNSIILAEVLVETGDAVEGETDADEVYYVV